MWRKVHTWLLMAVAVILFSMYFIDFCHTVDPATGETISIAFRDHTVFSIFTLVALALTITNICYRKNLLMQMRLCTLNALILVAYQAWIFILFFGLKTGVNVTMSSVYSLSAGALFPIICAIILVVAYRFIILEQAKEMFKIVDVPENVEFKRPKKQWWKK